MLFMLNIGSYSLQESIQQLTLLSDWKCKAINSCYQKILCWNVVPIGNNMNVIHSAMPTSLDAIYFQMIYDEQFERKITKLLTF